VLAGDTAPGARDPGPLSCRRTLRKAWQLTAGACIVLASGLAGPV